jgi:predicted TIM-barrel fold metal-dependent hydrolase
VPITTQDAPVDVSIAITPLNAMTTLADLLFCPALTKFPNLKIAMSEGGTGWVPYVVERCDYVYQHHHAWTHTTLNDQLPSERFRQHITTCFIDDATGLFVTELIGEDHVTWECDFPHSDSTWPQSPETLWPNLSKHPERTINKITHENAMRVFQYDPFTHIPKDRSTVGALRAQASDWDVAIRSFNRTSASVSAADLAELTKIK